MLLIVIIIGVVVYGYCYWMMRVDKQEGVVRAIVEQVAKAKGVGVIFNGKIAENKKGNIKMLDKFLTPGWVFEIRNKRESNNSSAITILNDLEINMFVQNLILELKADRRTENMVVSSIDNGKSKQHYDFVVSPRKIFYNKKERTLRNWEVRSK